MTDDREEQIRQKAYRIWQEEGEPEGREHEHWERAQQEFGGDALPEDEPEAAAAIGIDDASDAAPAKGGKTAR